MPGSRQLVQLACAVPGHGLERAGAVAQLQPQVVLAVALLRERCAPSRATPCPRPAPRAGRARTGTWRRAGRPPRRGGCSVCVSLIGFIQLRSRSGQRADLTGGSGSYCLRSWRNPCKPRSRRRAGAPLRRAPVCVLAKVGEASLKGRNRRHFLDALRRNLKAALAGRRRARRGRRLGAGDRRAGRARRGRGRLAAGAGVRLRRRVGVPALRARRRARSRTSRWSRSRACSRRPSRCACGAATSPSRSPRSSSSARSARRSRRAPRCR